MKQIKRTDYLNWLQKWKNQQIIKVVTGVRRCGKSTLFEMFQNELLRSGLDRDQIIAINSAMYILPDRMHILCRESLRHF